MTGHGESAGVVPAASSRTVVVAAMYAEIAPLVARMAVEHDVRLTGSTARVGRIGKSPVALACTGEGDVLATRGLSALLDRVPAGRVLAVGVAGGLSPTLAVGDLLVGLNIVRGSRRVAGPDPAWVDRALALRGARPGTLVSSRRMLCTAAEKAAAWAALRESAELAAVDLETAAWAGVAAERGLPFLAVRAICDTAREDLPFDLNECVDGEGRVRRLQVARRALFRPAAMRELWDLRRRVGLCARGLADFSCALLEAGLDDRRGSQP